MFILLEENGLVINATKCVFATSSLEFLGHYVTTASMVPLLRHVDAIQDFPQPQDIKQLQRFLGLINFYRRFLPGITGTLRPLTDALAGNPKKLSWTPELDSAFQQAQQALIVAVPLVHPDPPISHVG